MDAPRITAEEVQKRMELGEKVIFLDSRNSDSYRGSTVQLPGSMRVPPEDASLYANEIPGGVLTVAYCT